MGPSILLKIDNIMTKTYISLTDSRLSTVVDVDGEEVRIVFRGGDYITGTKGKFITDDARLQSAIESSTQFNESIGLVCEKHVSFEPEKELKNIHMITLNEAADWLVGHGAKKAEVRSMKSCVALAKDLGYNLVFGDNDEG